MPFGELVTRIRENLASFITPPKNNQCVQAPKQKIQKEKSQRLRHRPGGDREIEREKDREKRTVWERKKDCSAGSVFTHKLLSLSMFLFPLLTSRGGRENQPPSFLIVCSVRASPPLSCSQKSKNSRDVKGSPFQEDMEVPLMSNFELEDSVANKIIVSERCLCLIPQDLLLFTWQRRFCRYD